MLYFFHWEQTKFDDGIIVNNKDRRWVPYEKIRDLKLKLAVERARLAAPGLSTAGILVVGGVVCGVLAVSL